MLRITAPVIEAQIVETFLLSTLSFETMVASKAARMVGAAQGRSLVEFGSRRAHGPEARAYRAKFSDGKITHPGCKQVYRFHDKNGNFREDIIACTNEQFPHAEPLLQCVMRDRKRHERAPDLTTIRHYAHEQLQRLPQGCRRLTQPNSYIASFSERLEALLRLVRQTVRAHGGRQNRVRRHDGISIPEL